MTESFDFENAHQGLVVPIRSLGSRHRAAIAKHLLSLVPNDRYLRFGFAATDAQIQRYLTSIDFESDEVFGVFNRHLELIAMAHLAFSSNPESAACAEFGVSVLQHARGRGYGGLLFDRAVIRARNDGVRLLFIHALSENRPMIRIARKAGAELARDGSETEAHLKLAPANLESRFKDLVQEQVGESDYRLKEQAQTFWNFLATLQEVRQGVREGRGQAGQ
jgi:GNAT superfamily N-acetyltransferase